ncbi:probable CD2 antigen cytoplasmic tail-binding protein 2 at N-terminal half [Coccomyxa sp. Obi]|nr:probable CD2 antigen cytoplasmic tail-binding protein 2 at N-terminal half [Coccomyxa sp. Obi]
MSTPNKDRSDPDDDDLEGELTEGYRGAADVEDLLDDGEEQGPIKRTNPLFSAANRAARRKERAKLASVQDGSFLEDVASAEVNYAVHSQNWDNSGVPLEPFNLKHERETGYFDDDGNYVAYCDAEPDDAWLESLPRGPEVDQADEEESDGQGRQASNDEPQLSADTLRGYKEGIVDLLQPGESVFGALRRLAGLEGRKRVSDLRKNPGTGSVSARPFLKGRTVPPENRNAFDRLTTLSNALLVNGDYHVHANSREVLQADLLQHASGIPSRDHPNTAVPEQPAASSSGAATPQSARDVHGWRAFAARLPAPSSAASVQSGGEAQATDGMGVAAPADPEEDIFEDAQPASVVRSSAESREGGMQADGVVPTEPEQAHSPASGPPGAASGMPMDETEGNYGPPRLGSTSGQQSCASSSAQSIDAETVTAVACGRQPSPSCASQDTNMVFAEPPSAASGDSLPMEGFEYDADSGYYYNSLLGAYYDPDNRLFGDAASGHWFSLQNGEYQVVV